MPTMAGFVARTLRARGLEPVLAHYEPYSISPDMSVPLPRLIGGSLKHETRTALDGCESNAIGAWLPELEVTHYLATRRWRALIESASAYVVVCGNALGALPFYQINRPYLAWLASGWVADRQHRVREFPPARAVFDRAIVQPAARRLERAILNRGTILALSQYTRKTLDGIAGRRVVRDVLPMPIDTDFFSPNPGARVRGRIGFSGRLDDPRKNIGLLLQALALLKKAGHRISALLVGGEPTAAIATQIAQYGINGDVEFEPYAEPDALRAKLRTLDVFVVPSHQEGLCIAALEAMACGIPVVSTRCGGPEEFVIDGETGCVVDFDAAAMAEAIGAIVNDRGRRERLGAGAREMVLRHYAVDRAESVFWRHFNSVFPALSAAAA